MSRKSTSFELNQSLKQEQQPTDDVQSITSLTQNITNHRSRRNLIVNNEDLFCMNRTNRRTNFNSNNNHYHYYHHHHHHHHHSIEVEDNKIMRSNDFDNEFEDDDISTYSQSLSITTDAMTMNRKLSNKSVKENIFDSLYNQGKFHIFFL